MDDQKRQRGDVTAQDPDRVQERATGPRNRLAWQRVEAA
jgi:hypothetical protein